MTHHTSSLKLIWSMISHPKESNKKLKTKYTVYYTDPSQSWYTMQCIIYICTGTIHISGQTDFSQSWKYLQLFSLSISISFLKLKLTKLIFQRRQRDLLKGTQISRLWKEFNNIVRSQFCGVCSWTFWAEYRCCRDKYEEDFFKEENALSF